MTKKINISHVEMQAPVAEKLTFAILADLHNQEGARVADLVRSLSPDACLIPGDLFESPPRRSYFAYDEALVCLRALAPEMPLFYAPGNHDFTIPDEVRHALDTLGVVFLDNKAVTWRGIHIGGITSAQYTGKVPDLAFLRDFASRDGYKVLLSHHPEYYSRIRPLDIPLTIAGHAHGGQWRFFGRGVFSPGQGILPRYTDGLYENRLLVSRGLKISRPIPRFFNPREMILLTLTPSGQS